MNKKYSKEFIIKTIGFIRDAKNEMGDDLGEERVYAMLDAFDPSLKRHVLMELLTRSDSGDIFIKRTGGKSLKINAIKAIRGVTWLGLKEAKEVTDIADNGSVAKIQGDYSYELRNQLEQELVGTGYEIL